MAAVGDENMLLAAATLQHRCAENKQMEQLHRSKFHSTRVPQITMLDYMKRISKYAKCSSECFIIAIMYLDRYVAATEIPLTFRNIHRLIVTSVMIAAKLRDDLYYSNSYYGCIGGVANAEINALELEFLQAMKWNLWVDPGQYRQYESVLRRQFGTTLAQV